VIARDRTRFPFFFFFFTPKKAQRWDGMSRRRMGPVVPPSPPPSLQAVGANAKVGPPLFSPFHAASAMPNAGFSPTLRRIFSFHSSPEYFAIFAEEAPFFFFFRHHTEQFERWRCRKNWSPPPPFPRHLGSALTRIAPPLFFPPNARGRKARLEPSFFSFPNRSTKEFHRPHCRLHFFFPTARRCDGN